MHKQYQIIMPTQERKQYEKICEETKQILIDIAEKINDHKERSDFWSKIINFNDVMDIFKE